MAKPTSNQVNMKTSLQLCKAGGLNGVNEGSAGRTGSAWEERSEALLGDYSRPLSKKSSSPRSVLGADTPDTDAMQGRQRGADGNTSDKFSDKGVSVNENRSTSSMSMISIGAPRGAWKGSFDSLTTIASSPLKKRPVRRMSNEEVRDQVSFLHLGQLPRQSRRGSVRGGEVREGRIHRARLQCIASSRAQSLMGSMGSHNLKQANAEVRHQKGLLEDIASTAIQASPNSSLECIYSD